MREENDGLWGDLRITPSKVDDVTALLGDGIEQFSIEFRLAGNDHTHIDDSGTRWRQRVHLDRIALEPRGAYGEAARVTAFREALEEEKRKDEEAKREAENAATEAATKAEEDAALEAVTQAALERRAEWDKLVGRLDDDMAKQEQLEIEYGVMRPGGIGSVRRS
jgi:hypothetical protein